MEDTRGRWTAKLIGELSPWFHHRRGEVDFYLTQMLTEHGLFRSYLHKMGKVGDPQCLYCGDHKDDALHTFFRCERWAQELSDREGVLVGRAARAAESHKPGGHGVPLTVHKVFLPSSKKKKKIIIIIINVAYLLHKVSKILV